MLLVLNLIPSSALYPRPPAATGFMALHTRGKYTCAFAVCICFAGAKSETYSIISIVL